MEVKFLDLLGLPGHARPIEEDELKPIGRNESRYRYEDMYHDEQEQQAYKAFRAMRRDYGIDPRRRQEMADGGMVREDRKAMANLSNTALHHEYPKLPYYSTPYNDALVKSGRSKKK